eukprot:6259558-Prymnesium_polylepis.1
MTAAVPLHPLCCDYADALAAAHTAPVTLRSLSARRGLTTCPSRSASSATPSRRASRLRSP